jgi:hypothetical protein
MDAAYEHGKPTRGSHKGEKRKAKKKAKKYRQDII